MKNKSPLCSHIRFLQTDPLHGFSSAVSNDCLRRKRWRLTVESSVSARAGSLGACYHLISCVFDLTFRFLFHSGFFGLRGPPDACVDAWQRSLSCQSWKTCRINNVMTEALNNTRLNRKLTARSRDKTFPLADERVERSVRNLCFFTWSEQN